MKRAILFAEWCGKSFDGNAWDTPDLWTRKEHNGEVFTTEELYLIAESEGVFKELKELPTDEEVFDWYQSNIEEDCSASSAIYLFREWMQKRLFEPTKSH